MTLPHYPLLRRELDNGLRLLISENRRLPLISMTALVVAGADQNPPERPGLATLTARLLDEGSSRYSADQVARLVESTGGLLSTFSQREFSGVSLSLAADHWTLGVELLAESIRCPRFPRDKFLKERERLLNQLRAAQDDPQRVSSALLSRAIYRGTPLQHPPQGTLHGVRRTQLGDVRDFQSRKYAPQNTLLAIVGDIQAEAVVEEVETRFGDWRNSDYQRTPIAQLVRQSAPSRHRRHMEKEQVHILIGHLGVPRRHPDFHALQVLDIILGSGPGFTSRVPRKLRDDRGLAYTTYCDLTGSCGLYPGRFVAYISTSPENRQAALSGLLHELRLVREEGVLPEELSLAQDYLTGSFVFDFQSNADLARFLIFTELFQLGSDYPQRYAEFIRAVSIGEVTRVARVHLDTVNYCQVMVGPVRGWHAQE